MTFEEAYVLAITPKERDSASVDTLLTATSVLLKEAIMMSYKLKSPSVHSNVLLGDQIHIITTLVRELLEVAKSHRPF